MNRYISAIGFLFPSVAMADVISVSNLQTLIGGVIQFLNMIFPVLVAIAVFVIIIGIFKFIVNADDEDARHEGRNVILWGVIGVFLMLSVWGLINILASSFTLDNTQQNLNPNILGDPSFYENSGGGSGNDTDFINDFFRVDDTYRI